MSLDQVCGKKDKRLLVLLAFGAMIVFSDIDLFKTQFLDYAPQTWIELQGKQNRLFRSKIANDLTDTKIVKSTIKEPAIFGHEIIVDPAKLFDTKESFSIKKEQNNKFVISTVSPRLAFFLGQPFSINIAEADELSLIPGIGPAMAGRIIKYREINGPVTSAYQMEDIPGIGSLTRKKLQKYFTYSVASEEGYSVNN